MELSFVNLFSNIMYACSSLKTVIKIGNLLLCTLAGPGSRDIELTVDLSGAQKCQKPFAIFGSEIRTMCRFHSTTSI